MFLTKKLKSEKSQWIDLDQNLPEPRTRTRKGDSTLFLFVIYCLSVNYIHTGVLGSQTN